jgi:hypothetical protein
MNNRRKRRPSWPTSNMKPGGALITYVDAAEPPAFRCHYWNAPRLGGAMPCRTGCRQVIASLPAAGRRIQGKKPVRYEIGKLVIISGAEARPDEARRRLSRGTF